MKERSWVLLIAVILAAASLGTGYLLVIEPSSNRSRQLEGLFLALATLSAIVFAYLHLTRPETVAPRRDDDRFESRLRLATAIRAQERNSRTFVLMGTGIAMSGVVLLLWRPPVPNSASPARDFLREMGPVLLIESFAFYFLRLYKSALATIKYYENELINLDCRQVAIDLAEKLCSASGLFSEAEQARLKTEIISHLMVTERNRILEKGQTTEGISDANREKAFADRVLASLRKS